jgi:hypothetical protein
MSLKLKAFIETLKGVKLLSDERGDFSTSHAAFHLAHSLQKDQLARRPKTVRFAAAA